MVTCGQSQKVDQTEKHTDVIDFHLKTNQKIVHLHKKKKYFQLVIMEIILYMHYEACFSKHIMIIIKFTINNV